jgi:hypothetical protein
MIGMKQEIKLILIIELYLLSFNYFNNLFFKIVLSTFDMCKFFSAKKMMRLF